jgi:hypothetical protein
VILSDVLEFDYGQASAGGSLWKILLGQVWISKLIGWKVSFEKECLTEC